MQCLTYMGDPEDIIESMGKSMIEKALQKVIYFFEFPVAKGEEGIGLLAQMDLEKLARTNPITGPCGVVVKARTKQDPRSAISILSVIIRAMINAKLVDQDMIRQFHFDRTSSYEEAVEVFIVALDD